MFLGHGSRVVSSVGRPNTICDDASETEHNNEKSIAHHTAGSRPGFRDIRYLRGGFALRRPHNAAEGKILVRYLDLFGNEIKSAD